MYFFIEAPHFPKKQKVIKKTKTGKAIIETVLQTLDDVNRNNRVYEAQTLKDGLNSDMIKERMETKTFGGELDHPIPINDEMFNPIRQTTLMFKEMSHIILEYSIENKEVYASIETSSTPNGFTMAGLIGDGVTVGFSLRAIGDNVKRVGRVEYVQTPITIISYDCVSFPSHKGAYMKEIVSMAENTEIIQEAKTCKDGICMLTEHIEHKNMNSNAGMVLVESFNNGKNNNAFYGLKSTNYNII